MSGTSGKNKVIRDIRRAFPGRAMLVGDGGSDLEAADDVDLFVGFGGVAFRDRVSAQSPVYIRVPTLTPVLPLALGTAGNTPRFARTWADGLSQIFNQGVTFKNARLHQAFLAHVRRSS